MKPVVLGAEVPAHVGDRLLEALWREALWLVKDGVATTGQIDDIITHSFGLALGAEGFV
jgi:carnitine 3-dehydrogenase